MLRRKNNDDARYLVAPQHQRGFRRRKLKARMLRIPGWWLGYRRAVRSISSAISFLAGEVGRLPCLSEESGWGKKEEVLFLRIPTFSKRPQCRKVNTYVRACLHGIAHIALIVRKMNTEWLPTSPASLTAAKHESRAEKTVEEKQHPTQANPTSVLQRMNE